MDIKKAARYKGGTELARAKYSTLWEEIKMEMNQLQKQQTQRSITFKANGDDVTLSPSIVRDYLVRGNSKEVTRQEIAMFLNLCKFQHLNPFLNEAFIVKFGDKPAQLITSKEAFMKRAESHPQYNGLKAGVIVVNNNGVEFRNGAFTVPDFDQLVGGWCEVYRKDRDIPVRVEISLSEFSKGQSTWKTMPAELNRSGAVIASTAGRRSKSRRSQVLRISKLSEVE